jgi:polyribonucleotide nucleotidyltransferase
VVVHPIPEDPADFANFDIGGDHDIIAGITGASAYDGGKGAEFVGICHGKTSFPEQVKVILVDKQGALLHIFHKIRGVKIPQDHHIGVLGSKGDDLADLPAKLESYGLQKAAAECAVGEHTLADIAKELAKPGRDPRDELPEPILRKDVLEMKDLKPGMILTGTVRNVIDFGVFVDIGVHQDGLVHISQVCNRRLRHPSEAVKVGDIVKVVVLEVDEKRHRIGLSMKQVKE